MAGSNPHETLASLRRHDAELRQVCPQGIDNLGSLPQQKIARAVLHQRPCCSADLTVTNTIAAYDDTTLDNCGRST